MVFGFSKSYHKILSLILALIMAFALVACESEKSDEAEDETKVVETTKPLYEYKIAVIESASEEEKRSVFDGFLSALENSNLVDGENILIIRSTPDEYEKLEEYALSAVEQEVDLIFAIGEEAAQASAKATETIPVIFACVDDPIEAGLLTSCEVPDKNVTGVSDFVPVYHQLELLREIIPSVKNLSVLYCETDETSILVASLVKEESKDFSMNCSVYTATTQRNLSKALKNALEDADVLYLPVDTLTKTMLDDIMKAANDKKIPVISAEEEFSTKGALMTMIPDYAELGYTAGEMVIATLKGIKTTQEMPVIHPQECIKVINRTAAKALKIDISDLESEDSVVFVKTS